MAIITPESRCAICDGKLDTPYMATWGIAFPANHRLFRYCDAPLHFECLDVWADRAEFAQGYFDNQLVAYKEGYSGHLLAQAESWILVCGPFSRGIKHYPAEMQSLALSLRSDEPKYAKVVLRDWPRDLYSKWLNWTEFVEGQFRTNLYGGNLGAAEQVMNEVKLIVPNLTELRQLLHQHI